MKDLSPIALFVYDNRSFVIESFRDEPVDLQVILGPECGEITHIATGDIRTGTFREAPSFRNRKFGKDAYVYDLYLKPHSFKAFSYIAWY